MHRFSYGQGILILVLQLGANNIRNIQLIQTNLLHYYVHSPKKGSSLPSDVDPKRGRAGEVTPGEVPTRVR